MPLNAFLTRLANEPHTIEFSETLDAIDIDYIFSPSGFNNHGLINGANENNGACKIFAFAKLNQLSKQNTLDCFGAYYRDDVLGNPKGNDHMNIRTFMMAPETAPFLGITFDEKNVLEPKS